MAKIQSNDRFGFNEGAIVFTALSICSNAYRQESGPKAL